ncbi:hypothetical protein KFZ56_10580 [Virgibacillus sp. NKC19-3]|uniref:hypothetical protein n=1 Tax=Virgibacillus saliphilus TaxID=2831674 RepID=UPI001C9B6620|nr:hypothetical protein [Virgibacillus sp. NKC19-3]MBY7143483.1 hypothetical protein [Virgibacillus sp. NKC19-3]
MEGTYNRVCSILLFVILLSGCLAPQNELAKNQPPNEQQLEQVQHAVETYQEETQVLPIKTKPNDTPIFQKYLIDFTALKENNALSEIPGTAYENGGVYQYTLITPEENPRVKLIDLQITEAIRSVNVQLDIYRDENIYPPFGEEIAEDVYSIDYQKLGFESPPSVESPYSDEKLPIIMDVEGNLHVDYRIELKKALNDYDHDYTEGDDIRYILPENTPFVPAYSLPYTIKDGDPIFADR